MKRRSKKPKSSRTWWKGFSANSGFNKFLHKWKGSVAGLGGLSGPVDILPFNFCCSVYTLCLFGMSVVFQTCLGVCE